MAPATDTTKAKTLIAMAIHERIVGPLFRLLSISNKQIQCSRQPCFHPPAACAKSSIDSFRNSSEYAIPVTPDFLALCEARTEAYRALMTLDRHPERETDLSDSGWLAAVAVPALVAELRTLHSAHPPHNNSPVHPASGNNTPANPDQDGHVLRGGSH